MTARARWSLPRRLASATTFAVIALGSLTPLTASAHGQAVAGGTQAARPVNSAAPAIGDPDQVIDAGTDAAAAAAAINANCADPTTGKLDRSKCQWNDDGAIATAYGPARVIGDVLYNCSADRGDGTPTADVAIGVSDQRGEQTSLSESISLQMSLGFLDLEKTSLAFTAFSSQSQQFSTAVKATDTVDVPPGYKGFIQSRVLSAAVNGSVYITQGIHLIQVKDIDMKFPGYEGDGTPSNMAQVTYSGITTPMSDTDVATFCPTTLGTEPGTAPVQHFKITVCRAIRSPWRHHRRQCVLRPVTSTARLPHRRNITATLSRNGTVYASDRDRTGGMKLNLMRTITPGDYTLTIREKPRWTIDREHGKVLRRARQDQTISLPVKIAWTMAQRRR